MPLEKEKYRRCEEFLIQEEEKTFRHWKEESRHDRRVLHWERLLMSSEPQKTVRPGTEDGLKRKEKKKKLEESCALAH